MNDKCFLLVPENYQNSMSLSIDYETTEIYKMYDGDVNTHFTSSNTEYNLSLYFESEINNPLTVFNLSGSTPTYGLEFEFGSITTVYYWQKNNEYNTTGNLMLNANSTGSNNWIVISQSAVPSNIYNIGDNIYFKEFFMAEKLEVPLFDQEYSIEYSFGDAPYSSRSVTGVKTFIYNYAKNNIMQKTWKISWSGITATEKSVFDTFIEKFSGAFRPFLLAVISSNPYKAKELIFGVITDNISIEKDINDLYKISMNIKEM